MVDNGDRYVHPANLRLPQTHEEEVWCEPIEDETDDGNEDNYRARPVLYPDREDPTGATSRGSPSTPAGRARISCQSQQPAISCVRLPWNQAYLALLLTCGTLTLTFLVRA
jgi:hypothetical protein